ncbi:MAG: DUF2309 domain-containing protein [Planctomycetaceae bacterium]
MSKLSFAEQATEQTTDIISHNAPLVTGRQQADQLHLTKVLDELQSIIPPLWPLRDYVAVNPFLGLSARTFLDARQQLCGIRDCDLLMPQTYFQSLLENGEITPTDIAEALQQCRGEYPGLYADIAPDHVKNWAMQPCSHGGSERTIHTMADVVDQQEGSTWNSHIVNDISRYLSAHYDQGQAVWNNPWKDQPLYHAWRETAMISLRMEHLGIPGFRSFVAELPSSPMQAIANMLELLEVPPFAWRSFLMCELFSVSGWASYVRFQGWNPAAEPQVNEDLIGLLAIRLAYDVALLRCHDVMWPASSWPGAADKSGLQQKPTLSPPLDVVARYCLQVAAEVAYRRKLCRTVSQQVVPPGMKTPRSLQMVFCIDVRSEVFRRNLESVDQGIETFGFAGFFGMPFEYVPLGASSGAAQCPVLLSPGFQVHETIQGSDEVAVNEAQEARSILRTGRKLWKSFQGSAASCFSFVESMGLLYFGKLLANSLQLTRPASATTGDGVTKCNHSRLGPDLNGPDHSGLSIQQKVTLAENMLRNLGLTQSFARIVAICGHAADVTNNPYKSGLDCGACGGHSGEPNARVAAALLNDAQVREQLSQRGIEIPESTWFVAAVHNTTTDEIRFPDVDTIPETFVDIFQSVQSWTVEAGRLCRAERSARLGSKTDTDVLRRGRDWAEVRPEWGLANNAAFIVAPRSRTAGLNLTGRTFMHSYDHHQDPDLRVLELIMTAPMVVTSWINLQYYASAVDNRSFGSGNKLIHNVVGHLGVFEGNGGDLMTGLPWQSVHDGEKFQHEPLRLLVLIEAPRKSVQHIIEKHAHVRDLVTNGWLSLIVLEGEQFYRWTATQKWESQSVAAASC